jgi:hypothetical protein
MSLEVKIYPSTPKFPPVSYKRIGGQKRVIFGDIFWVKPGKLILKAL